MEQFVRQILCKTCFQRCRCPSSDGDESRVPAMCLVCGTVVCSQSYCCQTDIEDGVTIGAATAHANTCGAGTGIFLRQDSHLSLGLILFSWKD